MKYGSRAFESVDKSQRYYIFEKLLSSIQIWYCLFLDIVPKEFCLDLVCFKKIKDCFLKHIPLFVVTIGARPIKTDGYKQNLGR